MSLVPGSTAGPYKIIEPLGRGGMASVYRAYEPALDRYVALKVLPREFLHDPTFAERFRREAQVIARLEHPNIIPIYNFDIDREEGLPWMAMRLIAGGALSQLIRRERLALPRAVAILRGVADALDYAHGKGIVHRDVKPQNVLLDEDGRVYLADFGIAKILESGGGLTATGMITGTPQYMAPEQATATAIGPQADIYALGIVAYEMFTGCVPFSADTPVGVLMKHVQEPLPTAPLDGLPEPLVTPLLRSTVKKPSERWSSAGAFVSALESALAPRPTVLLAPPPTPRPQAAPAASGAAVRQPVARAAESPAPVTRVPAATGRQPAIAPPLPPVPIPAPHAAVPVGAPLAAPPAVARRGARPVLLLGLLAAGVLVVVVVAGGVLLWLAPRPTPSPTPEMASTSSSAAQPAVESPDLGAPSAEVSVPSGAATRPSPAGGVAEHTGRVEPSAPPAFPPTTAAPAAAPTTLAAPPPVDARPTHGEPMAPAVDPQVTQLAAALGEGDTASRWRAAQTLGSFRAGAAPAVPALVRALGDRSSEVRWRAAEALGMIGAPAAEAVPSMVRLLSDSDPIVRAETTKALGLVGEAARSAAPQLAQGLTSSDVTMRRESARALGRLGPGASAAVSLLVRALEDKDKFVRMEAARALGRVGPSAREAVPALTKATRDGEMLVAREARSALQALGN